MDNILEGEPEESFEVKSESFEKLLFQAAFQQFERTAFPYRTEFTVSKYGLENQKIKDRKEILAKIEKIAEKNQIKKAWFSDISYDIMLGISASIGVRISSTGGAGGFVVREESEIVEQVANEIVNMIGAKIYESNLPRG